MIISIKEHDMNMKRTYNTLGPDASFQYEISNFSDENMKRVMIISNNLCSLNVIEGDTNNIKTMIYCVDNIGSNITELDVSCFYGCDNLTSINIPDTIEYIGDEAFKNCLNLK